MADELTLTGENFDEQVLRSSVPALVDFWAEWCGPCKMLAPVLEEIAGELAGQVKVGKVNVDHCPELAEKYAIRGIPTLIIFHGGEEEERMVGVQPKETLIQKLQAFLDQNVF